MCFRFILAFCVLTVTSLSAFGASKEDALRAAGIAPPPKVPEKPPVTPGTPDMEPVMLKRGKLVWAETFDKGAIAKAWMKYKGGYEPDNDNIKVQELPGDGHHPEMMRGFGKTPLKDIIIQASFKYDGSKWWGLSLDNKEHVARCNMNPTGFSVTKMSGIGGTTKGENVDTKKVKFETGKWYTILWEIRGQEMIARIDDQTYAMGEMAGVEQEKHRLSLISGGEWLCWDDIRVWEGEENPKWVETKAKLLALKPAKPAQKKP
jgi:hypothetical protein